MMQKMLRTIADVFQLSGTDVGEYRTMKVNGMNFSIWAFRAEGLGHVSAMTAKGFFGLMKMDTLIITPTRKDMPLFSYDRVNAMGNDTLIFELYDTLLCQADLSALDRVKENYTNLPDHDLGEHWYDSIKLPSSISKKGNKKQKTGLSWCKTVLIMQGVQIQSVDRELKSHMPHSQKIKKYIYICYHFKLYFFFF